MEHTVFLVKTYSKMLDALFLSEDSLLFIPYFVFSHVKVGAVIGWSSSSKSLPFKTAHGFVFK